MILYLPNGHNQPGAKIEIMLRFIDVKLEIVRDKYHTVSESIYQSQYQSWPEPILKTKDGLLFSSHAIMRYLARETERLYGHNMYESSVIEQWLEFASEMSANLVHITEAVLGHRLCTLEQFLIYKKEIFESLKTVDAFLKQHKYLGSNNISIADISLACSLYYVYRLLLDEKKRKDLPNVTQWYVHMAQTKEFELQFGKMWLCQMELIPYFGTKSADKANESK